jgi:hypothetical protein
MFFDNSSELVAIGRSDGQRLQCGNSGGGVLLERCPGLYQNVPIQIDPVSFQDLGVEIGMTERPAG